MATVEKQHTDLVTIEVDGRAVEARKGEMIIQVTDRENIEIPRFCYHHKLSIAANCRMCLVDVEKAPKPLPACATPVADGMKVYTRSKRARDAQRGVMEFLLINHPLDCPICDQGGECELQDLAMGYGRSVSRFTERKRVVKDKNLGPLISTDMTRCIHCTRCVRFLEEVAGSAEIGGIGRGEHTEISTFIERNIESELSGNIIDLCPVGALTNKPFRFSARAWEMSAKPFIGTHDCLGSNLYYHVCRGKIMRAVPRDNEAVNECWLADRDRYSHFGLRAEDRVNRPQIKRDGQWRETDWDTALARAAELLAGSGDRLGVLVSPRATTEEFLLLKRMAEGLGTPHIDHRLRLSDDRDPALGSAELDRPTRELSKADAVFVVGSDLRHEQPILNQRVRTAWRTRGAAIMDLNPVAWVHPFDWDQRLVVAPQNMVETLARVARAAYDRADAPLPDSALGRYLHQSQPDQAARDIADRLADADDGFVLLGDLALAHPHASRLRALAREIARVSETALMALPGPANSQGAWCAAAVPGDQGLSAAAQLAQGRGTFLLYDLEPEFDTANPQAARAALSGAEAVVAVASFAGTDLRDVAEVLLPLAALPESDGSYINADGRLQPLHAAARPAGDSRPGWKILRALGGSMKLDGFDFAELAAVSEEVKDLQPPLPETVEPSFDDDDPVPLWRAGSVPIYSGDALVRRAPPLQQTDHADNAFVALHPATAEAHAFVVGGEITVRQGDAEARLPLRIDSRVAPDTAWLPAATCVSSRLGPAWGPIELERAR